MGYKRLKLLILKEKDNLDRTTSNQFLLIYIGFIIPCLNALNLKKYPLHHWMKTFNT